MPFGFHGLDLIVILVIALLIFGPKKLPEMGASIGKSIKEFQKGMKEVTGHKNDDDDDDDDDDEVEAKPVSSKDMKKLKSKVSSEPAPKSSVSEMSSPTETAVNPEVPAEATEVHVD